MGLAFGFALGWGSSEAFVIAGIVGISSSAIVTKTLVELHRLANPETPLILGIIVIEDLFLALYLAALAPVLGQAKDTGEAVLLFGKAAAFLVGVVVIARFGTRAVSRLLHTDDDELLVVSFVGIALLVAGVAAGLGLSDAIGAFLAGLDHRPDHRGSPGAQAGAASARHLRRHLLLRLRALRRPQRRRHLGRAGPARRRPLGGADRAGRHRRRPHPRLGPAGCGQHRAHHAGAGEFALILGALAVAAGLDDRIAGFVALYVLVLAVASPILATRSTSLSRLIPVGWVGSGRAA